MSLATTTTSTTSTRELGFSTKQGANWSEYLAFRPLYPPSFFKRIYDYHSQTPGAAWAAAHEVGAGCGIVSSDLASRFDKVLVADPNDGYTALARKLLVEQSGLPATKFQFLQEGAEQSSVASGTIDLLTACECMQWTDTEKAVSEFARELKAGGTLVMTYYTRPQIVGNERAQRAWAELWLEYTRRSKDAGAWLDHAFPIINTGLETVCLPAGKWEAVQRVYINAHGSVSAFTLNHHVGESRVREGEERVWVEADEDWCDCQDIDWFKGYFATWVPRIEESDIQGHWDELETALGGRKTKTETPIAMVFATKKA